ncbi:MAG: bifunctional 4'-phosphopantothenoylcysteine decarboxylase/phosphopantothenoylcysteine synthetase [SAR202 cluster bacterium Io17-Chloro-G3]|nr:MAG: bifunctional 4'-phosphopantothenoylcysteine decarboxylase/phosphopantothenoylcysteine synthetase [SAR202 cluster bacterium Io17-Chloro-G3]
MNTPFEGKSVVLCVTGSIACYKAVDLASKLTQSGALVDVILSRGAVNFVTPLTFRSITHRPVVTDVFDTESELSVEHVALAQKADVVVVAPATAHTISKIAHGFADDMITTTLLATEAPVVVAPAMDANMHENPAVQNNINTLHKIGITVVGPEKGRLASGLWGAGRLVEPAKLIGHIAAALARNGDLAGQTIIVSAGGTAEPIDPARVLTNRSTGKQGYAIAEAARDRGARVKLIAATTTLPDPTAMEVTHVQTVAEMRKAVLNACKKADVLIMAAAVSDFKPMKQVNYKIKKSPAGGDMTLKLQENPDFFIEIPKHIIKVGFAAESHNLLENARHKLMAKELDLIAANDITKPEGGFASDTNKVTLLDSQGGSEELPLSSKYEVGNIILNRVSSILLSRK